MVTKGAVEEMLAICSFAEYDGKIKPLSDEVRSHILKTVDRLNDKGFRVLAKGAVEEMLAICSFAEYDGKIKPLSDEVRSHILKTVDRLNDKGFRVLAIAQKSNPSPVEAFSAKDEWVSVFWQLHRKAIRLL